MAQYTYKVEELKKIIRESQNEFKPKLGASVEADNKRNSDKFYKETTKNVKDYDGGLTDKKPKTDKGFKDFNRTLLGLNPVSEPSKQYKDRVRAQVKGTTPNLMKRTEMSVTLNLTATRKFSNQSRIRRSRYKSIVKSVPKAVYRRV